MGFRQHTARLIAVNRRLRYKLGQLKQVTRALTRSAEKYREIVEHANSGVGILQDNQFKYLNRRFAQILGYSRGEIAAKLFTDLLQPHDLHRVKAKMAGFFAAEADDQRYEAALVHKENRRVDVELRMAATTLDGRRAGMVFIDDISDRKEAEEHIRNLSQQLMKAQETERRRIARDLHDHVAQDLSSLRIACETLFDNQQAIPPEVGERLSLLSRSLQMCISAVRNLAYELRPPGLDQLGLVRTVFLYCDEFTRRTGIEVDFFSAGLDDIKLDFDTEINLYRLVQEALNNVLKHAHAKHVAVRLIASHPNILLRIEDDGRGFNIDERMAEAVREKRMGLRSMKERVGLLRGTFSIKSRAQGGTRIFVEVPFSG